MFALIVVVVIGTLLALTIGAAKESLDKAKSSAAVDAPQSVEEEPESVSVEEQSYPDVYSCSEIVPSPLIVREMGTKATLLVRYRARKKAWTAHLIVWSGAKRRRISDSYYDLGFLQAEQPEESSLICLAQAKLDELAQAGKRKRKEVKLEEAPVVAAPLQETVAPTIVDDDSLPERVQRKKFPSVYRGIITEIGMMKQSKDGREFETFGVRYRSPEGIIDAIFGANLRVALSEARAGIGDSVEILKIGRKTVEKGKAPMNLFQVTKVAA